MKIGVKILLKRPLVLSVPLRRARIYSLPSPVSIFHNIPNVVRLMDTRNLLTICSPPANIAWITQWKRLYNHSGPKKRIGHKGSGNQRWAGSKSHMRTVEHFLTVLYCTWAPASPNGGTELIDLYVPRHLDPVLRNSTKATITHTPSTLIQLTICTLASSLCTGDTFHEWTPRTNAAHLFFVFCPHCCFILFDLRELTSPEVAQGHILHPFLTVVSHVCHILLW